MTIEQEIKDYLSLNLKELDTKSRDIDLVVYFYGFEENLWPTLEEAAIRFKVGDSQGRRSERPRQIINQKFRETASIDDFPSLKKFSDYLKSSDLHTSAKLIEYTKAIGLFDDDVNLLSLLRLLHDLKECKAYTAYTVKLAELTRSAFDNKQDIFIAKKNSIVNLNIAFKKSKTMPGLLGVANLDYLKDESALSRGDFDILVSLIKSNAGSCFFDIKGEQYYLFESRENTLINNLEKIRNIVECVDIDELTIALGNSLKRRTPPPNKSYASDHVIREYLLRSKYTEIQGSMVKIKTQKADLTDIEQASIVYMSQKHIYNFPSISSHLKGLGFSKPLIDKAILYSPLIFVNRDKGRNNYEYHLLSSKA